MTCPLLKGRFTNQCTAVKAVVVVSESELETFCEGGDYRQCPIHQAWNRRINGSLPLRDYLEINSATSLQSRIELEKEST